MNEILTYLKEDVLSSVEILKLWNAQGSFLRPSLNLYTDDCKA